MEWLHYTTLASCFIFVFCLGGVVGSFLNVLIVRMPFEKSVLWPGSRCFACLQPIHALDNMPLLGYLRLRGRCRQCHTSFSIRYMWVELVTGLLFLGLFYLVMIANWQKVPGIQPLSLNGMHSLPTLKAWFYFAGLAGLLSLLFAASVIDLQYRIIPPQMTLVGTILGILYSTVFPWPWPSEPSASPGVLPFTDAWGWTHIAYAGKIPVGACMWPVWGPLEDLTPGSMALGFVNGLVGAAVGMLIGRAVKFLFEMGFGQEAFGLGDADLLMMAGAFLGWQMAVIALPAGALILLPIVIPLKIWFWTQSSTTNTTNPASGANTDSFDPASDPSAVPFGPGIAAGIAACWLAWPWLSELLRPVFFSGVMIVAIALILAGGLLVCGMVLRRGNG